jgi:hypothetical protein
LSLSERRREVVDSGRILVPESEDDASYRRQLELLGISLDEFVENAGCSRLGGSACHL